MILTALMFLVALALSVIAAFYSIVGLTAIFSASVLPIIIMGGVLEAAKLVVTVWLHEHWGQCKLAMKLYLVPAVAALMLITSMGIFGFLSKAHLDQAVPTGDVAAQVALIDEKIKNERDTIENARSLIKQLDDAVIGIQSAGNDREITRRDGSTYTQSSAERALAVRRSQARDRDNLTRTIEAAQARIVKLQEEKAPMARDLRKIEAEVGPIRYVAALLYGDNPDENLLERAVRWMIVLLVAVFDPLAIMMLLAATESLKWHRERKAAIVTEPETPDAPANDTSVDKDLDVDAVHDDQGSHELDATPVVDQDTRDQSREDVAPRLVDYQVLDDVSDEEPEPYVPKQPAHTAMPENGKYFYQNPDIDWSKPTESTEAASLSDEHMAQLQQELAPVPDFIAEEDPVSEDPVIKQAQHLWKNDNPGKTLKEQRRLVIMGRIPEPGWMEYLDDPRIRRDVGFGPAWPETPVKGDMYVRIDQMPSLLYKFNGTKWIEVDKSQTDSYSYNNAYIEHLINKISTGEYDPELLTDAERQQIEKRLDQENQ
jgi:hypothetical protein